MPNAHFVTLGLCIVIVGLGIYFLVRWNSRSITQAPALLTMIGIAGTFFGIATGLSNFNPNNVQDSIPALIEGMKTSVWASLAGVIMAVILKLRHALSPEEAATEDNLTENELIAARLADLHKALVGDNEGTVISQLKLLRSDTNQRLDTLKTSQDEFMETLKEMSSKTLIEALRSVIKDFNEKITEQFGENFKELNQAVGKLLEWQKEYRVQLEELIQFEKASVTQLQLATTSYKETLADARDLQKVATDFRSILEAIEAYKTSLRQNAENLDSLLDSLKKSTPELKAQIESLVESVTLAVINREAEVNRIANEVSQGFKAAADAIQNDLTSSIATVNSQVSDNVKRLVNSTKEQTEALQTALDETLNNSLQTLGQQLVSLSSRFVDDYGPITDRLREIVSIGKRVG